MRTHVFVFLLTALLAASPADAATITGVVSDPTGAVLPGARVVLREVATGREVVVQAGAEGRYQLEAPVVGTYLVIASFRGFSDAVRTIVVVRADQKIDLPLPLELAGLSAQASVTAARADREIREIPLHVETLPGEAVDPDESALHRRRVDGRRQHHARGQRPVWRQAAASWTRFHAVAGPGRRRTPEHGPASHRPDGRRGRIDCD